MEEMNAVNPVVGFFKNVFGSSLYNNRISDVSANVMRGMGVTGPGIEAGCTAGRIFRSIGDSFTLGVFNFSDYKPSPVPDNRAVFHIKRIGHFSIIPIIDGALKVAYNIFAFVGNIFRALGNLLTGEGKKFVACLGFAGTNLVEIVRNTLRAIPLVGHGLAKIASVVASHFPGVETLTEKKQAFEHAAYNLTQMDKNESQDKETTPCEVGHFEEIQRAIAAGKPN